MNKSITMKTALAALACTACVSASAQKQYPEQEKMKPGMSEYWTPQPKVVTPGDIKTNSAPSDAIVLFDGKDLSAWQNAKGGPAEWIVKDGVFTVDKKKGDILTKQKFENFQLHIEWCVPENITGKAKDAATVASSCKTCMKSRCWIAITTRHSIHPACAWHLPEEAFVCRRCRSVRSRMSRCYSNPAPIFKEDGTYRVPPRVTVIQNGIVLQNNTTILGTTEYIGFPKVVKHGAGPIRLQSHGDPSEPISFRNIWIREM